MTINNGESMAQSPPFPRTIGYIAIAVALTAAIFGYILKYQGTNDSDQDYAVDLSPSSPALQQKVIDTRKQKINEEAEASDEDLDLSGNQLSMEIKLSAVIRASTANIDPTDEQLNNFYSDNSNNYTSDARIEFLYRMFNTADYGGNVVNIAHTALEKITRKGESLLDDQKVDDASYHVNFYTQIDEAFGIGFSDKLIDLINQQTPSLPCWDGPISGHNGVYLVCIKSYQSGVLPELLDIKDRVINDWRLSLTNQP